MRRRCSAKSWHTRYSASSFCSSALRASPSFSCRGSSIMVLMCTRRAAISRNSLAPPDCPRKCSKKATYCSKSCTISMSQMLSLCLEIRCKSRSSGPSKSVILNVGLSISRQPTPNSHRSSWWNNPAGCKRAGQRRDDSATRGPSAQAPSAPWQTGAHKRRFSSMVRSGSRAPAIFQPSSGGNGNRLNTASEILTQVIMEKNVDGHLQHLGQGGHQYICDHGKKFYTGSA